MLASIGTNATMTTTYAAMIKSKKLMLIHTTLTPRYMMLMPRSRTFTPAGSAQTVTCTKNVVSLNVPCPHLQKAPRWVLHAN